MANSAAVVYVYLEDADKTISVDDLKEWLQIIDEVVEMKLQYDAASKRTCYSVEFRKPASAQQAVQYLNGSRFKNCIVTIKSRVFSVAETNATSSAANDGEQRNLPSSSSSAAAATASFANGPPTTRKRCRESAALPHNHLLPADLQMDQLLVEQLPEITAAESADNVTALAEKLRASQEQLVATYRDLEKTKEELTAADAQLAKILRVHVQAGDTSTGSGGDHNAAASDDGTLSYSLAARRCVSHQRGISADAYTPSGVVSFVTSFFGPLSFSTATVVQREFFLVLKFVFKADEERFLATSADGGGGGKGSRVGQRSMTEKDKALLGLLWCGIDFSITSQDVAALSCIDERHQQEVRRLLS